MQKKNSFEKLTQPMQDLLHQVQINIPFTMLYDSYIRFWTKRAEKMAGRIGSLYRAAPSS
jgi:hypothetical protein